MDRAALLRQTPPHDPAICAWCLELRAEELMVPPPRFRYGTIPSYMAKAYHGRAAGRPVRRQLDPDADREMLWGDAPGV